MNDNYICELFGMITVFLHGCVFSVQVEIENFHEMKAKEIDIAVRMWHMSILAYQQFPVLIAPFIAFRQGVSKISCDFLVTTCSVEIRQHTSQCIAQQYRNLIKSVLKRRFER